MIEPLLVVDIGGTKIAAALATAQGKIYVVHQIATEAKQGGEAVMQKVIGLAQLLQQEACASGTPPVAAGIATAGQVDPTNGTIRSATSAIPGWAGIKLRETLEQVLHIPVFVDNDAVVMALGEAIFGAGRGCHYVIGLTVGTGIGGGIIINREIYHGGQGFAGHIGHMIVDYRQEQLCSCGGYGCLEAYASAPAITADFIHSIGQDRLHRELALDAQTLDVRQIAGLAAKGVPEARDAVLRGASFLGIGVAALFNLFNPDVVVVGGGVAQIGESYLAAVRRTAQQRSMPVVAHTPILAAELGTQANLAGAAWLAYSRLI